MADEEIITIEKTTPPRRKNWRKVGILFSSLVFIIFVFVYGYIELTDANLLLARKVSELQTQGSQNHATLNDLQQAVTQLQQDGEKSKALSQQQEQLVKDWQAAQKGDLEQWQVAEAEYLTKLANDLLQLTANAQTATVLLERADKVLQSQDNAKLFEIRKALGSDLAQLKSLPLVDITGLYLQLSAFNEQIDQLPLPAAPLQTNAPLPPPVENQEAPWWKRGLDRTWQTLQKIVIVRRTGTEAPPLVLPDEKMFLYQNLHAQLEAAMWGLLHRNGAVYQTSLEKVSKWLQTYFDVESPVSKNMLQRLADLKTINIEPPKLDLSATLQRFDDYFKQVRSGQTVQ